MISVVIETVPSAVKPLQLSVKRAIKTNLKWTRQDNLELMEL